MKKHPSFREINRLNEIKWLCKRMKYLLAKKEIQSKLAMKYNLRILSLEEDLEPDKKTVSALEVTRMYLEIRQIQSELSLQNLYIEGINSDLELTTSSYG